MPAVFNTQPTTPQDPYGGYGNRAAMRQAQFGAPSVDALGKPITSDSNGMGMPTTNSAGTPGMNGQGSPYAGLAQAMTGLNAAIGKPGGSGVADTGTPMMANGQGVQDFSSMNKSAGDGVAATDPPMMADSYGASFSQSTPTGATTGANALPGIVQTSVDRSNLNPLQTALDTGRLSSLSTDFSGDSQRVRDAMFRRTSGLLDPEYQRSRNETASRLANQGIVEGSQRWDEEMNRLDNAKNQSLERAGLDADINAGQEQARLFQQALAARQQGVSEQGLNANMGLSARTLLGNEGQWDANNTFNQSLGTRAQLAGEQATARGQDVALAGQQAQAGAQAEGYRLTAAQAAAANDLARSRLGMEQDNQGFNQWLLSGQFARQGVPTNNFGTPIPLDVTGAANVQNQANNAQTLTNAQRQAGYWSLAGGLLNGLGGRGSP